MAVRRMANQPPSARPFALIDTRIVRCGDSLDLIYIDPPFNSNRNFEVFRGETKERRAFANRHASRYSNTWFSVKRSHAHGDRKQGMPQSDGCIRDYLFFLLAWNRRGLGIRYSRISATITWRASIVRSRRLVVATRKRMRPQQSRAATPDTIGR